MMKILSTRPRSFDLRSLGGSLVLATALPLLAVGCGAEDPGDDLSGFDHDRIVEIADDATCVALYAGQTIEVGTVCVAIDNDVDTSAQCGAGATGVMTVEYATTGGWTMSETHLAVGDALSDIPTNRKGNPQIGNFPYAGSAPAGSTSVAYQVPLCTVGLDGADDSCDPVNTFFAAHAVVEHVNGDGTVQTETAWGDGERMVSKGSWAEYFNLTLECSTAPDPEPPTVASCETAFALAGDGSETCFIGADFDGDGVDDGISRWGWSNGPLSAGSSRQWPVYAAAGQCDIGRGELVGYLSVDYDGANAEVTFDRVGDFVLEEEQLYIGNEPLPRNGNGDYTVAPGQYPLVVDLDEAAHTTHTVTGLSGDIYVVYHSVACGTYGKDDGGTTDGGTTDKPADPLASMNDEFDGDASLWSIYRPQDLSVAVANGQMVIEPTSTGAGWYMADQGGHVNQTITGNFAISTYIEVTTLGGGSTFPGDAYRVGGLMVRDPAAPTVNSYHMAIGNMGTGSLTVVSKNTDDSYSTIGNQSWTDDLAEMKLCRVGSDVQALIRLPGDPWRIIDWHVRPDLPQTVVAGPVAYGWHDTTPDLRATCDWVRFETVETLHDCMND